MVILAKSLTGQCLQLFLLQSGYWLPLVTQIVYQNAKLAPPAQPGSIQIVLPKSTPPLATNKPYHWFLTLNMGCTIGQRPIFVDGWVQRQDLTPDLRDRMKQATPTAQVALYAENGFWYDALTTLATLRSRQPQDSKLNQDWENLLTAIDLGFLIDRPLREVQRSNQSQPLKPKGF
jgi:Domain of Unknown Function (DUF928)